MEEDPHQVISPVKLPFAILIQFIILGLGSLGIGLVLGLIASYIFKKMRFLTVSAIKEVLLTFCFGYLAYGLGEMAHMSGIICLLTTGVVFAHYGWFNLSPQGKHLSSAAFQVIGFGFEAFVFCYLGLSFFSFAPNDWSWQFILLEGLVCIIARMVGTVGLIQLMRLLTHVPKVSLKEQFFICYAGLIRGAIAFGLVLRLTDIIKDNNKLQIIETTALTLVVSTTLIFGSTMSIVQKALLPKLTEDQIMEQMVGEDDLEDDQAKNLQKELESKQSMIENDNDKPLIPKNGKMLKKPKDIDAGPKTGNINQSKEFIKEKTKKPDNQSQDSVNESSDHFEEFLHPNMRHSGVGEKNRESMTTRRKNFNSCKNCFRRFDELIMKPIFIHKYDRELVNKKAEFMEMFLQEADVWEKAYIKEEFDPKEVEENRAQRGVSVLNRISMMARRQSMRRMSSVRSISAGNFGGPRTLSQPPGTPMYTTTTPTSSGMHNNLASREPSGSSHVKAGGAYSPKSDTSKLIPNSMGNKSPMLGRNNN